MKWLKLNRPLVYFSDGRRNKLIFASLSLSLSFSFLKMYSLKGPLVKQTKLNKILLDKTFQVNLFFIYLYIYMYIIFLNFYLNYLRR